MKKFLVILSAALLALCGLVVTGAILAGDQPQGQPSKGPLWEAINGLEERIDNEGMPLGAIIMWSGDIDTNGNPVIGGTPDTNWQICDGSNFTPDLRDRFVVGSGYSYSTGNMGGANSATLGVSEMPSHNHSFSDTSSSDGGHTHYFSDTSSFDGGHTHYFSATSSWNGSHYHSHTDRYVNDTQMAGSVFGVVANDSWTNRTRYTSTVGSHTHSVGGNTDSKAGHTHSVGGNTDSEASHTHSVSGNTGNKGGNSAHENRPLYYALAFIMKIQ